MGGRNDLGSLNFNNSPSLTNYQFSTAVLASTYNQTKNFAIGLQLEQTNQYNRTELFSVSPLSRLGIRAGTASNPCGCSAPPGYTPCCPVQYTTNSCGVVNSVGQCVNQNPF